MQFRYSTDFRCGIAVFADFFCVVLWFWGPPNAPLLPSQFIKRGELSGRTTRNSKKPNESACIVKKLVSNDRSSMLEIIIATF